METKKRAHVKYIVPRSRKRTLSLRIFQCQAAAALHLPSPGLRAISWRSTQPVVRSLPTATPQPPNSPPANHPFLRKDPGLLLHVCLLFQLLWSIFAKYGNRRRDEPRNSVMFSLFLIAWITPDSHLKPSIVIGNCIFYSNSTGTLFLSGWLYHSFIHSFMHMFFSQQIFVE